jgi:hypothetical protein
MPLEIKITAEDGQFQKSIEEFVSVFAAGVVRYEPEETELVAEPTIDGEPFSDAGAPDPLVENLRDPAPVEQPRRRSRPRKTPAVPPAAETAAPAEEPVSAAPDVGSVDPEPTDTVDHFAGLGDQQETGPNPSAAPEPVTYTRDEVREKIIALVKKRGEDVGKSILDHFGIAKLSLLPETSFAEAVALINEKMEG